MVSLKQNLSGQFRKPTGLLGWFTGWLLAVNNKERSLFTVRKLNPKPTDYLLEIGYGPGVALNLVAQRLTSGFLAGIDHSEVMFRQAAKRNKKFVGNRKLKLHCGTLSDLSYPADYFDIIYGSNVHFFWDETVKEFQKIYSLLKPKGRLVMVFQPRWARSEEEIREIAKKTSEEYRKAGFRRIVVEFEKLNPVTCIYIEGRKLPSDAIA